ncbi:MAG: hypothetical protein D6706_07555 [Chloroflexi bacterium]|nr:MAG: hypothetical protein D6706_07555 [Chloroflexota bacterium]
MDVGVGSAGNMLFAGYTNEVYSGDYVYNLSLILAINDNGLLWKDILEGNHPTWSSGVGYVQIIGGPDVNREFVVEVLFKEQPHPDSTSERWLIKCSPSAGIIWRTLLSYYDYGRELGHSGSIYEYTNDQTFIKEDDEFNTLWTDTLPAGQYFRGFAENPTDNGIIVSLYSSGTFQYECLSADGTTRWMFSLAQGSWGFDLEGHIIIASGLNASVYQIDENDGTVVTASHIPGLVGGRIVPNTLHNLFILNRRHTAKLAPLPDMIPMDANRDALTGQKLYLIRVSGDAPNRTVDTLGIVTTGNDGNRAKTSTVEEMSC